MTIDQDKIPVDISNAEIKAKWGLSDNIDPQKVDLDAINPANNDWFGKNLDLEIFKRLRQESPVHYTCLLYTSPSPRDLSTSRMPSSA